MSLVEAKLHLGVTSADDDDLISTFIKAATGYLDGYSGILGRCLITQTWELTLDRFPSSEVKIPIGPLQSIVSVKYDDADGIEQTVAPADYDADIVSADGWVLPIDVAWPSTYDAVNAVRIRFVAGYGAAADVPAPLKVAILLMVGHWYANREAVGVGSLAELPMGAAALLAPYRRISI
ncbi:MAG: phage head-tail connector protein [Sphingomonas sp.]|nr:phage head-tail connector protein [Sphingomonas sp.]